MEVPTATLCRSFVEHQNKRGHFKKHFGAAQQSIFMCSHSFRVAHRLPQPSIPIPNTTASLKRSCPTAIGPLLSATSVFSTLPASLPDDPNRNTTARAPHFSSRKPSRSRSPAGKAPSGKTSCAWMSLLFEFIVFRRLTRTAICAFAALVDGPRPVLRAASCSFVATDWATRRRKGGGASSVNSASSLNSPRGLRAAALSDPTAVPRT